MTFRALDESRNGEVLACALRSDWGQNVMAAWIISCIGASLGVAALLLAWSRTPSEDKAVDASRADQARALSKRRAAQPIVILAIAAIGAVVALAFVSTQDQSGPAGAKQQKVATNEMSSDVAKIEAYLGKVGRVAEPQQSLMPKPPEGGLPDVETMIERLAQRLEHAPNDVDGWKTLGWSYQNTNRPAQAVTAYERALALAPERKDLAEALAEARSAVSSPLATSQTLPQAPTDGASVAATSPEK